MLFMDERTEEPFTGIAVMDGYQIAERLLEGVEFFGHITNGVLLKVEVNPEQKEYFTSFNKPKWLFEAKEFMLSTDVLTNKATGEDDVYVIEG